MSVASGGYLPRGFGARLATSTSVNNCYLPYVVIFAQTIQEWLFLYCLQLIIMCIKLPKIIQCTNYRPVLEKKLGTFSITFFMGNCKPQTAKCHVTTALRSRLQFAVHVWTAGRASSGKWFTARFFATKNCTASRLKVRTSFLYPFSMCLLDFLSRINELLLSFGRLKWWTSTWWKQHGDQTRTSSPPSYFLPY